LPQPNDSSMRFLFCWLTAYPAWRVVRPSMAERLLVSFCATCGVTLSCRRSATKSRVS
jgi:hypothetical protein